MIVNNMHLIEKKHKVLYDLLYLFMLAGNNFPAPFSPQPPPSKKKIKNEISKSMFIKLQFGL